jgi:hypothetical protein
VDNKEPPEETSISFSPLILIFTGPEGANFCFTNNSNATNNSVIIKNATTAAKTVFTVLVANMIIII